MSLYRVIPFKQTQTVSTNLFLNLFSLYLLPPYLLHCIRRLFFLILKKTASAIITDSEDAKMETKRQLSQLLEERDIATEKKLEFENSNNVLKINLEKEQQTILKNEKRLIALERTVQNLTDQLNSDTKLKEIERLTITLQRKEKEATSGNKEMERLTADVPKMQETFRLALKDAMERAANEATLDADEKWKTKMNEVRSEYVSRESNLNADVGASRSRLREATDRLIELERHTAHSTATLDVVKRENVSLQSSLDHARNELTSGRIRHQQMQQQQQQQQYNSMPPPAPHTTSFYTSASTSNMNSDMRLQQPSSVEDSRRILAIQNQVSSFIKKNEKNYKFNDFT